MPLSFANLFNIFVLVPIGTTQPQKSSAQFFSTIISTNQNIYIRT